jgi:type VI protein secretion system component Hcp
MALTSIFLKLYMDSKAVKGEAETKGYEGQIECDSFKWDLDPATTKGESTARAHSTIKGKPVTFSKLYDEASGIMMLNSHNRTPFTTARFTIVTMALTAAGGKSGKMMELLLTDGYIESIDLKANESSKAISIKETVTLSYKKSELMYYPPDLQKGGRGAPMTFQYVSPEVDD